MTKLINKKEEPPHILTHNKEPLPFIKCSILSLSANCPAITSGILSQVFPLLANTPATNPANVSD